MTLRRRYRWTDVPKENDIFATHSQPGSGNKNQVPSHRRQLKTDARGRTPTPAFPVRGYKGGRGAILHSVPRTKPANSTSVKSPHFFPHDRDVVLPVKAEMNRRYNNLVLFVKHYSMLKSSGIFSNREVPLSFDFILPTTVLNKSSGMSLCFPASY